MTADDAKVPLKKRLHAWWHGYKIAPGGSDGGSSSDKMSIDDLQLEVIDDSGWGGDQLQLWERLWGDGFISPGGKDHYLSMTNPFSLTEEKSLLDYSGGLGGGMIEVAEKMGCYVDGLDLNADLVAICELRIGRSSASRKLKIKHYVPAELKMKRRRYEAVVSCESLCWIREKRRMLKMMDWVLRIDGMLSLTDFVLPDNGPPSKGVEKWLELQPAPMHLWSRQQYDAQLGKLKLDICTSDDVSKAFMEHILVGFRILVSELESETEKPSANEMTLLMKEAERWARCSALLESGELMVMRYFAIKTPQDAMDEATEVDPATADDEEAEEVEAAVESEGETPAEES